MQNQPPPVIYPLLYLSPSSSYVARKIAIFLTYIKVIFRVIEREAIEWNARILDVLNSSLQAPSAVGFVHSWPVDVIKYRSTGMLGE